MGQDRREEDGRRTGASQAEERVEGGDAHSAHGNHGQPQQRQPPEAVDERTVWLLFKQFLQRAACLQIIHDSFHKAFTAALCSISAASL